MSKPFVIDDESHFKYDSLPLNPKSDYRISPGDRFSFIFYTNNGEKLLYNMSGAEGNISQQNQAFNPNTQRDYLVRLDGTVELPLVGILPVFGLTTIALEDTIVSILAKRYINPFVQIRITNQRIVIFPGRGKAQVVYLRNENTSLLEALAIAGGIAEDGKANSIKLMRKTRKGNREIYKIDLSTIKGIKEAEMIVQSEDYIYIDYRPRVANRTIKEIAPWLQIFFTSLSLYAIIRSLAQ